MEDLSIMRPSAISSIKIRRKTKHNRKHSNFSNPHNLLSVGALIFLEGTIK